ncbi:hypothetical protein LTR64_007034 [Lithohypha guttulata]|uniref:uncharacterized protein n=1 Tax=Lithohypha guttulata TaxID=1690604 RepID=UPI002DE10318|nr:hypothetical protein LTR51_004409 [Lithohypha guttulata]
MFLQALATLSAILLSYRVLALIRNYLEARRLGLPIIVVPLCWQDTLWALFGGQFEIIERLPFGLGSWYKYSLLGWNVKDCAFTIVSPLRNEVVISDTTNIREVLGRYRRWEKPKELYGLFAALGPSVSSVSGEEWPRHRKVMNVAFQEKHMHLVWKSARKQAGQWLRQVQGQERDLKELAEDCNNLSGNVLMYAAFGQDREFGESRAEDVQENRIKSFYETMQYMLRNMPILWLMTKLRLPRTFEPKKFTEFRQAKETLLLHLEERLQTKDSDFLTSLVNASDSEKLAGRGILTKTELYGNLFMIQVAGQDTTSHAMQTAIALLAANPDIQEWARQEASTYEDFEKPVRLQAVMYETLRLYGGAPNMTRISLNRERMTINGKDIVIPANTFVSANLSAQSYDPALWIGASEWRPQRWMESVDNVEAIKKDMPELMAWSTGPRNCPGKKFSQVEFTAAISKLLVECQIRGSPGLQEALNTFDNRATSRPSTQEIAPITFVRRQP